MGGEKMIKPSSFGNMVKKRLSDITNSLPHSKSPGFTEKMSQDAGSTEYIDKLVKENMTLVKLLQDKNKIIEMSGTEIQNLRNCLQKMQLQNWNLAQSNSHMLAELNLGKDRLKVLQHELACKEALLKARNQEMKVKEAVNGENKRSQECEVAAEGYDPSQDNKRCNARRGRRPRSQSLGSSTNSDHVAEKEPAEKKRCCLRRQSASSRMQEQEDLFEIELPPSSEKEVISGSCGLEFESREKQRTSIGRPLRSAAQKVHSYKEIPVNIKMRRQE